MQPGPAAAEIDLGREHNSQLQQQPGLRAPR